MKLASFHASNHPWLQKIRGWDWTTIGFVLAVKVLLFTFVVQSVVTLEPLQGDWMEIWNRWDAVHYVGLAEHGYVGTGEDRVSLVFYPLYPWLVRGVAVVTRHYVAAAFLVSAFASIAAGLLLRKLTQLDQTPAVSWNAVWFLFIFPTSHFLHIGYTESLFLALVLGCFLAARKEWWLLAGMIGACASLTRVNGLLLMPALALEAFAQYRGARRLHFSWLWIGLVPLGFGVYLCINQHVAGDAFAFSKIMEEHWFKKFTPPWVGLRDVWLRIPGGNAMEGLHEFFFILLTLAATIWCWIVLRPSYAIWMTCNWLLINSTSFVLSVPRYGLALFPLFILFARSATSRPVWFAALSIWSLLYLALYAGRFVRGLWAF